MKLFSSWDFDGNEYKIFLPIVYIVVLLTLSLIGSIFYMDNFSGQIHAYSYCPEDALQGKCFNSFYQSNLCGKDKTVMFFFTQKGLESNSTLCSVEFMKAGEKFGDPQPFIVEYVWYIVIGLLVLGGLLNHMLFNRGYRKNISVKAENENKPIGGQL